MAEIKISVKNNTPNINVSSGGKKITVDSELSSTSENPVQNKAVTAALADKVDKVEGKGLSSNDYTIEDKVALQTAQTQISDLYLNLNSKVDKVSGKGLSSNDFTDDEKTKLAGLPTSSQLSGLFEQKINKVTSLTSAATNTQYPSAKAVVDYAEPKTDILDVTTTDMYTVSLDMITNVEVRLAEMTTVDFACPNGEYANDYMSGISFKSGATPTHIEYSATGIIQWVGTDCFISDDNKSIFKPSANTQYDIVFYYNGGSYIVGCVNGYKLTTGNAEANAQ